MDQRDNTAQYYPNPNHKRGAKCRIRTPNPYEQINRHRKESIFAGYTLGLGVLTGEADPNQVEGKV